LIDAEEGNEEKELVNESQIYIHQFNIVFAVHGQKHVQLTVTLICPMPSQTRQYLLFYQVKGQALIYMLFYSVLCWFFLCSCCLLVVLELQTLEIFWKITLHQTAAI